LVSKIFPFLKVNFRRMFDFKMILSHSVFKLIFVALLSYNFVVNASEHSPNQIRNVIKNGGGPEQILKSISTETAKLTGQMIDSHTQLTGVILQGRTIVYYLRLVNYEKGDIPNIPAFRRSTASTLSNSVCSAPIASILINEHKAEYKYMVYSKSRVYLFNYSFNSQTCSSSYKW